MNVYTIITPKRVFTFGSWKAARTFLRRAERLPSMRGQKIEFVATRLFRGARHYAAPIEDEWTRPACGCAT